MKNIIGRKVGMASIFAADGRYLPFTVIEVGPCIVLQRKTVETDGYEAAVLAFGDVKAARITRAHAGRFTHAGIGTPKRRIREFRRHLDDAPVGSIVEASAFSEGDVVDVVATSKGHGFAGGMKRHNFSGGSRTHGSMIHRQPASNGDTNSGHTHRGSRRPGHYGVDRTTHRNLKVVRVDAERNLLLVHGPVPGATGATVLVKSAIRPRRATAPAAAGAKK